MVTSREQSCWRQNCEVHIEIILSSYSYNLGLDNEQVMLEIVKWAGTAKLNIEQKRQHTA